MDEKEKEFFMDMLGQMMDGHYQVMQALQKMQWHIGRMGAEGEE